MKKYLYCIAALTAPAMLLPACGKRPRDFKAGAVNAPIEGRWTMVKKAYDDNYNLKANAIEVETHTSDYEVTVWLNEDGSGLTARSWADKQPDTATYTWVRTGHTELRTFFLKNEPSYIEKSTHISKLTATEMVLIDTQWLPQKTKWALNWTYFRR